MTRFSVILFVVWVAGLASQELQLDERGTFELDVSAPPAPVGRVVPAGHLILTEGRSGVVALSSTGTTLWRREVGTKASRITAVDGDIGGRVFALDATQKIVHVMRIQDGAVEGSWRLRPGTTPASGPYTLAADHDGGVILLTEQGTLEHYSPKSEKAAVRALPTGVAGHDPIHAGGWIGKLQNGDVFVRPPGSLKFSRLASEATDARQVGVLPFDDESSEEHSTVFATAILSDGRLVSEVVHRARATGPDGLPEVRLARRLYIFKNGSVSRTGVLPLRGGVGQLIGAGPGDELWFVTTRQMLRPGERPRLTRAVLQ